MTLMRNQLSHPTLVIASLAVLAVASLATALAMRPPTTPTTVAVVDLEVVYDKLDQHKASEIKLNAMVDELAAEIQKRDAELKMIQLELQTSFTPQSQGFLQAQASAQNAIGRLRAYQEFAKIKTERESERLLKATYDEVKAACAQVSKEIGIQLVLLDDATPAFASGDPRPMMQQISARRSLYVDPTLDITNIVIERLNLDFAAKNGGTPTTPSTPPAPAAASTPAASPKP